MGKSQENTAEQRLLMKRVLQKTMYFLDYCDEGTSLRFLMAGKWLLKCVRKNLQPAADLSVQAITIGMMVLACGGLSD